MPWRDWAKSINWLLRWLLCTDMPHNDSLWGSHFAVPKKSGLRTMCLRGYRPGELSIVVLDLENLVFQMVDHVGFLNPTSRRPNPLPSRTWSCYARKVASLSVQKSIGVHRMGNHQSRPELRNAFPSSARRSNTSLLNSRWSLNLAMCGQKSHLNTRRSFPFLSFSSPAVGLAFERSWSAVNDLRRSLWSYSKAVDVTAVGYPLLWSTSLSWCTKAS